MHATMSAGAVLPLILIAVVSFVMSYVGSAVGMVLGQLRVALLTYVLGSVAAGVATSLVISTLATVAGAVAHARGGRVQAAPLLLIGVPSAIAAYASTRYASQVDPLLLKLAIAATLFVAGVAMLRDRPAGSRTDVASRAPSGKVGRVFVQVAVGAVLGAISGLVGLLLGTLRLPAMLRFARMEAGAAVGTNMAIGALTGLSAGVAAIAGGTVDPVAFAIVCPITLVGAHLGAQHTGRLDKTMVRRWIGYVLVPTAIIMATEVAARSPRVRRLAISEARSAPRAPPSAQ